MKYISPNGKTANNEKFILTSLEKRDRLSNIFNSFKKESGEKKEKLFNELIQVNTRNQIIFQEKEVLNSRNMENFKLELKRSKKSIDILNGKITELQEENKKHIKELNNNNREKEGYLVQIKEQIEKSKILEDNIKEIEIKILEYKAKNSDLINQKKIAKENSLKEEENFKNIMNEMTIENQNLKRINQEFEEKLKNVCSENFKFKEQIIEIGRDKEVLVSNFLSLSKEKEVLILELGNIKNEIQKLIIDTENREKENKMMEQQVSELNEISARLKEKIDFQDNDIKGKETLINNIISSNKKYKFILENVLAEKENLEIRNSELYLKAKEISSMLGSQEQLLISYKNEELMYKNEMCLKENQINILQNQYENLNNNAIDLKEELRKLKTENLALKSSSIFFQNENINLNNEIQSVNENANKDQLNKRRCEKN